MKSTRFFSRRGLSFFGAPASKLIGLAALTLLSGAAHASSGGGSLPWEGPLGIVIASLQGPTAYFISVAALFASGAALVFGGEMNEFVRKLLLAVIAISLLIFGGKVLTAVFGVSALVF